MSNSLFLKYKNHIEISIANAANLQSKITNELLQIEGMTGKMTKHFYNNLLELDEAKYLEIGCYKGSSTCSALYKNKAEFVCIDNWHDFFLNELHNLIYLDKLLGFEFGLPLLFLTRPLFLV